MGSSDVKRNVVLALCKYLSLDSKSFTSDLGSDFKSLCTSILKSSTKGDELLNNSELPEWIGYVESFLESSNRLNELNGALATMSVVMGNGLKPTAADVIVFAAVHSHLIGLSESDRAKFPHLLRWADYIQTKEEFGNLFEKILLEKVPFVPPVPKPATKVDDSKAKKAAQETKPADKSEPHSKAKKSADAKKNPEGATQDTADKKKPSENVSDKKVEELSVSLLKIQIGHIITARKHPSADSLLVEEIDVGEAKHRQVVSGLAKYCSPEELTNRRVVLITNVKPGKLRDVMSEGLVLCASNEDHTVVEPLMAPDGAKIGECVTFSGHDGKPEDILNPKKKQLDKITPNLYTDAKGVATFKGIPFMTCSGPCTSSIPNASIK
ncbi:uncharacterized protein LOC127245967 [Andrographis paniculata]|uniref:uncharacterized protein LOC127245967 n=1 Tax=Andrographis paniculata TaxID=175694 RepID=UPI0021E897CA|nr:uncharacterized protein LOC127245967 [Andrographis paniculata]